MPQAQDRKRDHRQLAGAGEGEAAVMGFALTRLDQDRIVELMNSFQPAVTLEGVYL